MSSLPTWQLVCLLKVFHSPAELMSDWITVYLYGTVAMLSHIPDEADRKHHK